jgi:hypothetical protein
MKRSTKILLIILGILVVMLTIHFTINGFPSLRSLNPHAS